MYDERFTTVTAEQAMRDAGLSGQRQRKIVDQMAAAVMLQAWLDHRRHTWDKP
jgi:putative Holliday junction resolvase